MPRLHSCILTVVFVVMLTGVLEAQWVQTNGPGSPVVSLVVQGTDLYAGTNTARGPGGVYVSTIANPTVWTSINSGLTNRYVSGLGAYNSLLFAGTYSSGPFFRYSGGTWSPVSWSNDTYGTAFIAQDSILFEGTFVRGAYRSSDLGITWTQANTGMVGFHSVQCFALNRNNLFAGTSDSGVYRSTNYGANWIRMSNGLFNQNVYALAVIDTILFASVPGSFSFMIYRSTNNGASWDLADGEGLPPVNQFAVSGRNIFGVAFAGGVYVSTNLGTTWSPVNTGLPAGLTMLSIAIRGTNLYAGSSYTATTNGFVYSRPLSEMITDVHESGGRPTEFELEQNYPNPFNPATTITFALGRQSSVSLKVFDVLGREVATLVNGVLEAGDHSVKWDGTLASSGVYFYRLQAGAYTATRKLVLSK